MHRKLVLILAFVLFLNFPQSLFANVLINEVAWKGMSAGSTHEWLELYNDSNDEVDISNWTIKDNTNQLNILIPGNTIINSKSYFVVKRTTSTVSPYDISVSFNGGLSDSGEKIILQNSSSSNIHVLDFLSGWPNSEMTSEQTMQWNGNTWLTGLPTPKSVNQILENIEEENTNTQNENTTVPAIGGITSSASTVTQLKKKTELKIISKNSGFVGIPVEFEARLEGVESQNMYAKYIWNFGDGDSMEIDGFDNKKFSHTYYYPGDYLVNIEYFTNSYQANPDYVSKINLKIVPTTVVISSVGTESDFFIELKNNSSLDIDISNWVLLGNNKIFTLPKSTNLLSMKKIILPPRVTNFNHGDKNFLELLDKNGTLIFSYKNILNQPKITTAKTPRKITPLNTENISLSERIGETFVSENEFTDINFENEYLSSAVILSDDKNREKNNFLYIFLFIFLIIFATLSVYFLRRNRKEAEDEEFDILEE